MNLFSDGVLGGEFSILGQDKAGSPPIKTGSTVNATPDISVTSGSPNASSEGVTFPGTVGESTNYPYHEVLIKTQIPPNPRNKHIAVTATVSCGGKDGQIGVLSTSAYVENTIGPSETGSVSETTAQSVNISSGTSKKKVTLFSGFVDNADAAGNTIEIRVSRAPDDGTDTAKYSAIRLENIQVAMQQNSVGGITKSNQFTYSK
jgi:hypothetical protein